MILHLRARATVLVLSETVLVLEIESRVRE
ncbi:MAG: hypothetical protein RL069_1836 [Planctomycetota bacterium]